MSLPEPHAVPTKIGTRGKVRSEILPTLKWLFPQSVEMVDVVLTLRLHKPVMKFIREECLEHKPVMRLYKPVILPEFV